MFLARLLPISARKGASLSPYTLEVDELPALEVEPPLHLSGCTFCGKLGPWIAAG